MNVSTGAANAITKSLLSSSTPQPLKVLIFGYQEFSQLMGTVIPEFTERAQFRIVDAIVGSISEIQSHIADYQPDAIVSAGSNAAYLKSALSLPVLSLEVSDTDIIRAVNRAAKVSSSILLISMQRSKELIGMLEKSLNISIRAEQYTTPKEARELFDLARPTVDDAVVGASLVCGMANQANIKSFIYYSADSCRKTLEEAISRARTHRENIIGHALNNWLLNQSKTPILMINARTNQVLFNAAAETELNLGKDYQMDLEQLVHPRTDHRITDGECQINGKEWWFHLDTLEQDGNTHYVYQLYNKKPDIQPAPVNRPPTHTLAYRSKAIEKLLNQVSAFSASPSNILITGESGTGKELIARAIHRDGPFQHGRFVALNCSAIPTDLFEGELFGYLDGAFTGSRRGGKKGLVQEAENGVLFLDEISELALDQQAKLLRFLQERTLRPLGASEEKPVNLKLVAASNKPLADLVESGAFRKDLYYRLNVFNINVPPLRMRPDDIQSIALNKLGKFLNDYRLVFDPLEVYRPIEKVLNHYSWPGNVRELENILERLVASMVSINRLADLPALLQQVAPELFAQAVTDKSDGLIQQKELELVADAMAKFDGDKRKVADYLGMSQTTLWRRLKRINH
ncbi:sigma 54-interacting transcriptional regulator [Aestuariibacter salexigens]|uniref:sigma 54-interacting transcriptional regulator n=1 Tax=Aestuariibacter salexigens TaxID=226010 RepID=UPI000414C6F4|nr:sigma 54-interacting transcriptional regulator [Aestuariibacter salexigens]